MLSITVVDNYLDEAMTGPVQNITDALEIVNRARIATHGVSPAAWDFLWRVTQYLSAQQKKEFEALFGASELQTLSQSISQATEAETHTSEASVAAVSSQS